jgi:GTP-binding protein Era
VGKAGAMLKSIGARARAQMAKDFGFTVHLFLFVKVKEDWQTSPESFAAIGLES